MARRPLDAYETPKYFVDVLREAIPVTGIVFEPCAGDHAIARFFPGCLTNDIAAKPPSDDLNYDATKPHLWNLVESVDWVITNPPFNLALEILEHALDHATSVAMILRVSFLEPTRKREQFLVKNPPQGLIYLPRFSFTGDGKSDMTTVAWHIWSTDNLVQKALRRLPIKVAGRLPEA